MNMRRSAGSDDGKVLWRHTHGTLSNWLRRFFIPPLDLARLAADGTRVRWIQVREQILTGLLRVAAILGLLALAVSIAPVLALGLWPLALLYCVGVGLILLFAIFRQLSYRLRAGSFLAILYLLALGELASFGYTEDAYAYLTTCALLMLILFGTRAGVVALLIGTLTLAAFGLGQQIGLGLPLALQIRPLTPDMAIATSVLFLACVGVVQAAITLLLNHIDAAWQESQQARSVLEQRVAERTHELAEARDQALALSRYRSEQNQFLSTLHQTALDLLQRQERAQLLQSIVERASSILDAPYGQLLLIEGDRLRTYAYTSNVPDAQSEQIGREQPSLAWQALETRRPAVADNYAAWAGRRRHYDQLALQAAVNFPILIEQRCLGVLALARSTPGHPFSGDELQKGQLFSQLAAVAIDNADLYATALHEIAERRAAEEEVRAQNVELDAFAHTVAHDLKSPLTTLIGNSELLQLSYQQLPAHELGEQLSEILRAGRKMYAIIDALLMLASVRSRVYAQCTTLAMGPIVAESLRRLQPMIQGSQALIETPSSWPGAYGFAPWVEEIWVNYLSNAMKYGGRPPQIQLGAHAAADGQVCFWVQDNGPGLTPAEQTRLFTPFTRLQHADIAGHGLGLSIVQRIAAQLGGHVGVESSEQGSRFFFTLPATGAAPPLIIEGGGRPAHDWM